MEFRCPECADVIRQRPMLRYFYERASKGEEDNPLLQEFFAQETWGALVRQARREGLTCVSVAAKL